ncbi:MAG: phage tail length tape measure family protein, partial [Gemmatimonadaceae bacterium]
MADNIELVGITLNPQGVEAGVQASVAAMGRLNDTSRQSEEASRRLSMAMALGGEEATKAQAKIDAYMRTLSQEAETVAMTAGELAEYRAKLLGASDAEAAHARTLGATIAAQKEAAASSAQLSSMIERVGARALTYGAIYGAVRLVSSGIKEMIDQTEKDEQANARLDSAIKATGGAAGLTRNQLIAMAEAMQSSTLFNVEDIKKAEGELLTFRNITGDVFGQVLTMAANIAANRGGDIVSWAQRLGRAWDNPAQSLGQLTRVGIVFTAQERDQIKTLQEHNELGQAQAIMWDKLKASFDGAAESMHTGLSGATHDVT